LAQAILAQDIFFLQCSSADISFTSTL